MTFKARESSSTALGQGLTIHISEAIIRFQSFGLSAKYTTRVIWI